jgi:ribosomal protein S18 acetylase RimI-like enzyme
VSEQLALTAPIDAVLESPRPLASGYEHRPVRAEDEATLARLYLSTYGEGVVHDAQAAAEEMRITFLGSYGRLDMAASPVILRGDEVVASVLTVVAAPWAGSPPGPFVIEVMVDPAHRRRGLARAGLQIAATSLRARATTMALFVMSDNGAALALYRTLGFVR